MLYMPRFNCQLPVFRYALIVNFKILRVVRKIRLRFDKPLISNLADKLVGRSDNR